MYNKAWHLPKLMELLEPLGDIAEVCIFDNGSSDGLSDMVKDYQGGILMRYHRAEPRGSVDYGWLGALGMARGRYLKLQLGDDYPNAEAIRQGVCMLHDSPDCAYVLSAAKVRFQSEQVDSEASHAAYFEKASEIRKMITSIDGDRERAEFVFRFMSQGNRIGDINGVIFRSETLRSFAPLIQSYYGCITHPDIELYLYLVSNFIGCYNKEAFSSYASNEESPHYKVRSDPNVIQKVYQLPNLTQTLLLYFDPGFGQTRANVSSASYWLQLLRFMIRIIKEARKSRRVAISSKIKQPG
jgi:glycosyltransferase involved in cell wall biosynthesis